MTSTNLIAVAIMSGAAIYAATLFIMWIFKDNGGDE